MGNRLYRYVSWDDQGAKQLLTENKLYLYSAEKWKNDGEYHFELLNFTERAVFELVLSIAIDLRHTNFQEYSNWMTFYAREYGIDLSKLTEVQVLLLDQYFAGRIANCWASNPEHFIEGQRKLFFDRTGIVSLSRDKRSYCLWNSKRNLRGENIVCLGIDTELLKIALLQERNCLIHEVIYSNEISQYKLSFDKTGYWSLLQLLEISFNIKSKFKCEQEVRIQRLFMDTSEKSPERHIILPNNIIKEIIILRDADEATQIQIREIANQKGISKIMTSNIIYESETVTIF
jgi:hypothetical protein